MAITNDDLKYYKSQNVNDGDTNGGRMSAARVTSGAAANYFEGAEDAELLAGSAKYRKLFLKVDDETNGLLSAVKVYFDTYTPGEDRIWFFPAAGEPQTQEQVDADPGAVQVYGCGQLNTAVVESDTVIIVDAEADDYEIFVSGMVIRISDKDELDAGNAEYLTVDSVVWTGAQAEITTTTGLVNAYSASNTRVSSVYEPGDIQATVSDLVITVAGDGDIAIENIVVTNKPAIFDTWTLTKLTGTNWNITGAFVGDLGTHDQDAEGGLAPNNTDFTLPYWTIDPANFTGTFAEDDTIVFVTHPSSVPVWLLRTIPAASAPFDGSNKAAIVYRGSAVS